MTCVVNVTAPESGYRLRVEDHGVARFYGFLRSPPTPEHPDGKVVCITRCQKTAADAAESATNLLVANGLSHVATALRASAAAELRQ